MPAVMTSEPNKKMNTINYDAISDGYDRRYETAYRPDGIASKLLDLVRSVRAHSVLEVGCGTGHWLGVLQDHAFVVGMDLSSGMLQKAAELKGKLSLVQGDTSRLPFSRQSFDVVFCVNALHHFRDPSTFVMEAHRLLRQKGALAVIGMDPHTEQDRWFIYDYFPGTRETDLQRYPSPGTIADWMITAGFESATWQVGERILDTRMGREVFPLPKNFTSQLTLLTPQAYRDGIARIEAALQEAETAGETPVFHVDISLAMVTGRVQGNNEKLVAT
jgi:SAM-dependent methyltransferase